MPARHAIWKVGPKPTPLDNSALASEEQLEDMIVANTKVISDEWMLIGRQVETEFGGRIDLLAVAPDGSLVIVELKRNRAPRDVIAQAVDYASWIAGLKAEHIAAIYARFSPGRNLWEDLRGRFGREFDEDSLNKSHQIIVVASSLDDSTERMVKYLGERKIPINVLFFQVFAHGNDQFLSRAWLVDPARTQASVATAADGASEPWNGEFYCSFGHSEDRSWEDATEYGFISAGGGAWYSRTLELLKPGDRVWVKVPGLGFVGVGRVTGQRQPASTFKVKTPQGELPVLEVAKRGHYLSDYAGDPDACEYFVPMEWLQTVPVDEAFYEVGLFGNQNTICQPTTPKWRSTVERLKLKFSDFDKQVPVTPA